MQGDELTGRVLARVLHGLGSPAHPREEWLKSGVWGRYDSIAFLPLKGACQRELDETRMVQRRRAAQADAAASAQEAAAKTKE